MGKRKFEINKKILRAFETLLDIIVMAFSLQLIKGMWGYEVEEDTYFTVFVLGFCSYGISAINSKPKSKKDFIKDIVIAAIYFLISVILLAVPGEAKNYAFALYCISYIFSRVFKLVCKPKISKILLSTPIIIIFLLWIYATLFSDEWLDLYSDIILGIFIPYQMLIRVIILSFSHIRYDILSKVIRKSMAPEILTGLMILIVSFSFAFTYFEPTMESYGDALWYCFAIVTTIGFGDFTAESILGRILSVILGIYGIIVVALITSIIVNFYTEMNRVPGDEKNPPETKPTDNPLEAKPVDYPPETKTVDNPLTKNP